MQLHIFYQNKFPLTYNIDNHVLTVCSFLSIAVGVFCCTSIGTRTIPLNVR